MGGMGVVDISHKCFQGTDSKSRPTVNPGQDKEIWNQPETRIKALFTPRLGNVFILRNWVIFHEMETQQSLYERIRRVKFSKSLQLWHFWAKLAFHNCITGSDK